MITTRFAPSPTGYLHLGHAYSALFAYRAGEKFILRIEDIDKTRCRPEYIQSIYDDLSWLGIEWQKDEVLIQSEHFSDYANALEKLSDMGLIYKCFCTRKEIREEAVLAGFAPHEGETIIYSGKCRDNPQIREEGESRGLNYSLRLNVRKAEKLLGKELYWYDRVKGKQLAEPYRFGDIILARKDCPTSYYLSCVYDDARQGINLVTRGMDLFSATDIQVLLQALLGFETPEYYHHELINDADGKRMAKRISSPTIKSHREQGASPEEVISLLSL